MKRIIALLLVFALCFSITACGSHKNPIIGEWISDKGVKVVFTEDGNCLFDDMEVKWSYDEKIDLYTVYAEIPLTFSIQTEDGIRFFDIWGMTKYYHSEDYDKVPK